MGRPTFGPFDLDALTGEDDSLGCAYLNGEFYVTARGNAGGITAPHSCFVFDPSGTLIRQFQQANTAASPWGWRDGTSDRFGTLMFGYEGAIDFVDSNGVAAASVFALNGPQPVVSPLPVTVAGITTCRAMAFDPGGNGGNGSIFVADFGSDIVEIDLAGTEINRIIDNGTWSIYGMARDEITGNLWVNSSPGGQLGRISEIDIGTGAETGVSFSHAEGIEGGLEFVLGGADFRGFGADLVSVVQGAPDVLTGHRLHLYDQLLAHQEVQLLSGKNGGPLSDQARRVSYWNDTSYELDLVATNPSPTAIPVGALFFNIPPFGVADGALDPVFAPTFPELTEVRYLDAYTVPVGIPLTLPYTESAPAASIPMVDLRNIGVLQGDVIRVQAIYGDLSIPATFQVMYTNQTRLVFDHSTPLFVTVQASGPNSFNAVTTSGFWSITNNGAFDITAIEITLPVGGVWDPDQTGMADTLEGGNSTLAGCLGTYRNGSDVTADLSYGISALSPCDPSARTGFNILGGGDTLYFEFRDSTIGPNGGFQIGETFEWDADTDGIGLSGDAHAGAIVTLTVFDPGAGTFTTVTRGLEVDPGTPQTASANF